MLGNNSVNPNEVSDFKVLQFVLMDTGGFQEQYLRPYTLRATQSSIDFLMERIAPTGAAEILPQVFFGTQQEYLLPSAEPEINPVTGQRHVVGISGGWAQNRLRFFLAVECVMFTGTTTRYYFQGWTDKPGITIKAGTANETVLDPDMLLIVNSVLKVNLQKVPTPHGYTFVPLVGEKIQVASDPNLFGVGMGGCYLMRPADTFLDLRLSANPVYNHSFHNTANSINSQPKTNTRSHNRPAQYLADVLTSYNMAAATTLDLNSTTNVLDGARTLAESGFISRNPFLSAISSINNTNMSVSNQFIVRDLLLLAPEQSYAHQYIQHKNPITANPVFNTSNVEVWKTLPVAGMSMDWRGSDLVTSAVNVFTHQALDLMFEFLLSSVDFKVTNMCGGGQTVFAYTSTPQTFVDLDLRTYFEFFKNRIITEVMSSISLNNSYSYEFEAHLRFFGTSFIEVSMNGEPKVLYTVPSFSDAMFNPNVTCNQDTLHALSSGIGDIIQNTSNGLIENAIGNYVNPQNVSGIEALTSKIIL